MYDPYEVITDTPECLHLKESESRERPRFVRSKIIPLILIMFVWLVLQQIGSILPMGWNYTIIAVALLVAAMFAFRQSVTEIKITANKEIFLVLASALGNKKVTIPITNIKTVTLTRKVKKVDEAFFSITLRKPNVTYLVLNIPFANSGEPAVESIRDRLESMLQIRTEGK